MSIITAFKGFVKSLLGPTYLNGIDTSHHQGTKNWPVVLNSGKADFVYLKLSEGETYTDPDAETDVAAVRLSTTPWGGYHFFRPTMDIQAQAQNLWRLGQYALLPPWLDVELVRDDPRYAADLAWWVNTPRPQKQARIKEMLDAIEALFGMRPVIYTADWMWRTYVGLAGWEDQYPLAVASYTAAPILPPGWTRWTFWQYSASGIVPGISKPTDLNYFNGTITDLLDLCEEPEPVEVIARATVLGDGLRLRAYPWGPIIGSFKNGTVLDVYDMEHLETWVEVPGGWVCERQGSKFYLDLEEPTPPTPPIPSPGFDSPVGTPEERAGAQVWPGDWFSAQGYLVASSAGWHTGVDLNKNVPGWNDDAGKPAYACADGVVIHAEYHPGAWGGLIVIQHAGGICSRYGHLRSDMAVTEGQIVVRGDVLGYIGKSPNGEDGSEHLHFDIADEILAADPANWPGADRESVAAHYHDPAPYIRAHRGAA